MKTISIRVKIKRPFNLSRTELSPISLTMAIAHESNLVSSMNPDQHSQVQRIREALGAVAAREPAVFWLYAEQDGAWCVRREGDESERRFSDTEKARDYLSLEASRCASYRLFVSDEKGRFTVESFNWPATA